MASSDEPKKVFLGGACGTTVWRKEIAIPALDKAKITYHNPQQECEWTEEMMKEENEAKKNAKVQLFVLDKNTRGIASIVEIAFLSGQGRLLVAVIPDDCGKMGGLVKDKCELTELRRSLILLGSLLVNRNVPVFSILEGPAMECVEKLVKGTPGGSSQPSKAAEKAKQLWEKFLKCGGGGGTVKREAAVTMLKDVQAQPGDLPDSCVTFADVCDAYATKCSLCSWSWVPAAVAQAEKLAKLQALSDSYDVYLGGDDGGDSGKWREKATKELHNNNFSCYSPQASHWFTRDAVARDRCRVQLFVVSQHCRSLAPMLEAAHSIGLGRKVVLLLQQMPDTSDNKDYNRGRKYLEDIANNATNVHLLRNSIDEAVKKAAEVAKQTAGKQVKR